MGRERGLGSVVRPAAASVVVSAHYGTFDTGNKGDLAFDGNVSKGDFQAIASNKHSNVNNPMQWAAGTLLASGTYKSYTTKGGDCPGFG